MRLFCDIHVPVVGFKRAVDNDAGAPDFVRALLADAVLVSPAFAFSTGVEITDSQAAQLDEWHTRFVEAHPGIKDPLFVIKPSHGCTLSKIPQLTAGDVAVLVAHLPASKLETYGARLIELYAWVTRNHS